MDTIEKNIPYFNFSISPLSGEKVNEILKKVNEGSIHYLKVNGEEWSSSIIKKDTYLFNFKSPLSRLEDIGKDTDEVENIHSLENISTVRKENDDYYAGSDGILVQYDSMIKFIPLSYDAACEVEASEDKKTANAKFFPALNGGKPLTENGIIHIIRRKNISVNLEMLEISGAIEWMKNSNEILENVVVARGKEPELGKEAWIEYLFDTDRKTGPVINEDGNIDFHNLNLIESVSKDQKVGIYHPLVEGVDGHDVYGEKIPPPKLKFTKKPKGQNVYYSEEEPNIMLSKIDGYIALVRSEIIITNLYNIRGDVDFHTGNIVSKGSLNITGNVKTGFSLDMSETITIGGYVKDSMLNSGGNITIRGGFSGTGKGTIKSGGNITIRYIRNQSVYARGDILVEKEVVEAQLFAKGDIKSVSSNMLLIGGQATAGGNVEVKSLGHEYGMETIVKVGYDYDVTAQIKKYDELHKTMHIELTSLKEQIASTLSRGAVSRLAKALMIKQQMLKKKYDILTVKRKELKEGLSTSSGSKVIVSGKIYPGVEIFIDGFKFKVTEVMQSKIFTASLKEEGIVVSSRT